MTLELRKTWEAGSRWMKSTELSMLLHMIKQTLGFDKYRKIQGHITALENENQWLKESVWYVVGSAEGLALGVNSGIVVCDVPGIKAIIEKMEQLEDVTVERKGKGERK